MQETKTQQQIERSRIIGGSDISAIMGLSRWKTPLALWAEKTGKIKEDPLANFEQKEIGLELEEYVAKKFQRKTGLFVRRQPQEYRHPEYPYMIGHIDRLVLDGTGVLECKTTSAWNLKSWEKDEIPQEYVLQVMWYLGLTSRNVGWIAVLIGGQKFLYRQIAFDQELFDRQVLCAKVFMENFIEADVPPVAAADDQETLACLYPQSQEKTIRFDGEKAEEINDLIDKRAANIVTLKNIEAKLDELEAKLKQALGDAAYGKTDSYRFSWKTQEKTFADYEKLKADGLFEKYSKTTNHRVLRIRSNG